MQKVNEGKRSSQGYVGSVYTQSAGDMLELDGVRNMVKNMNKQLRMENAVDNRGHKLQYRVVVKGREPFEKVNGRSYHWSGDIVGGLANAKRLDVYIARRYPW